MSELLANTLPIVAQEEGIDWEEDCLRARTTMPFRKRKNQDIHKQANPETRETPYSDGIHAA